LRFHHLFSDFDFLPQVFHRLGVFDFIAVAAKQLIVLRCLGGFVLALTRKTD